MNMRRKIILFKSQFLLGLVSLFLAGCDGERRPKTQSYPTKSISIICPWGEGGGTDRLSRFMASQLEEDLGVPVVVKNKKGGRGAVGHSFGANAAPDGYTMTMGTFELSTMHWMKISDLSYLNYKPLAQLNADPAAIIVRSDSDIKSIKQLLEVIETKKDQTKLKFSGTSTGGAWDLARAGWLLSAGLPVDSVIWVPTDGSKESILKLLGGHIDVICCSLPEADANLKSGDLVSLVVMSENRLKAYPEVPTLKEMGYQWTAVGWRGLLMPVETPQEIIDKLSESVRNITESTEFSDYMEKNRFAPSIKFGAEFKNFLQTQDQLWKTPVEKAGL